MHRAPNAPIFLTLCAALAVGACKTTSPTSLDTTGGNGETAGEGGSGGGTTIIQGNANFDPEAQGSLGERRVDYSEALRTASLKLLRALPTLKQIKHVASAEDKKAAYEEELDAMFADPRFTERMIKWWQDTMRVGGAATQNRPSRDTAPTFAARVFIEEQPYSELFTAPSNTCPTYDAANQAFQDGECNNNAPAVSGVLTDPGVMHQFYGSMAFRRVRWVQEIFVCTKFPAEYSSKPVHMGAADYTSPWPFASVATAPINFQDTSSVICANCHTTINHIAPLFGNFDDKGMYQSAIKVMTPTAPDPVATEMNHWLADGEKLFWRNGVATPDLVSLGAAIAEDPDVAECAVARMWNFAMSKEDIVSDLATVPPSVLDAYVTEFQKNGQNLKKTLRAIMTSSDFVKY